MKKFLSILFVISFTLSGVKAQKTAIYNSPEDKYRLGLELFQKEKYGAAREMFSDVFDHVADKKSSFAANVCYYKTLCAIKLFNSDAEQLMLYFAGSYPTHPKQAYAHFHLGNYLFSAKKYTKALEAYKKSSADDLNVEEKAKYHFSIGYCNFVLNNYDQAKIELTKVMNDNSDYSAPAIYYYSHILYSEKKYETALNGFKKLLKDETFKAIVPYYITQIYYLQQKYDDLIKTAPELLEVSSQKRAPEIARLLGDANFKTGKYEEAIKYLNIYLGKKQGTINREDYYQLGFAYYKTGDYPNAIENLQKAVTADDTLSQNIYYHLADCYIKSDQKKFATNAFLSAYKLDFDPKITEDALFNYAKLSYELSYNPYNEAIASFQKYIKLYPNSQRADDCYGYLVKMYLSTKNYKDALESIESIKNKDEKLKAAYQKIAYYRGVELFNDKELNNAIILFDKAAVISADNGITAQAGYWKAEAFYRLAQYDTAARYYQEFLITPGAFELPCFNTVNYNLGYCYLKNKDYKQALASFKKFLSSASKEDKKITCDANIRAGDCYYINKDYTASIDFYDKAISIGATDKDYAMYQKAMSLGVLSKYNEKISILQELISKMQKSSYLDDSRFELANTYLLINDQNKALQYFKDIIDNYPKSAYVKEACLKAGLIYYNLKSDEASLTILKKVVSDYPATPESKVALITIRNIYVDQNKPQEYFAYVKNIPFTNVSNEEQDSITYIAAENTYIHGDCDNATPGFTQYLEKFPNGFFTINANFYRAECLFKASKPEDALINYSYVISQPRSRFTENALLKAAQITFMLKDYTNSVKYYRMLEESAEYKNNIQESCTGIMRASFLLKDYLTTIKYSRKLLWIEKTPPDLILEARYKIGKSAYEIDSISLAQKEFFTCTKLSKGVYAAEAAYYLALIEFNRQNYNETENMIFDIINQYPSYDYWIAKSFILLADVYEKKNNLFQAKQTLQSVIDNYKGTDEIKQTAIDKLKAIEDMEKALKEKPQPPENQEIHINDKF